MKKLLILMAVVQLAAATNVQAQDDDPWWKKLFKQDSSEDANEKPEGDKPEEETENSLLENFKIGKEEPEFAAREIKRTEGNVSIKKDARIDSLDNKMKRDPRVLHGYRIQIFFGDLSNARKARADYIQLNLDDDCYLEQSPPNFGVRVGDFRTREEAYEVLMELKKLYPTSYIVPAQIELPRLPDSH